MPMYNRAVILNDLANNYAVKMRYTKAIEKYREALSLYIELAKDKPVEYGIHIAHVFSNLSIIYLNLKKYTESELLHLNALKMHRALTKHNPQKYSLLLINCLIEGVCYLKQHTLTLYEAELVITRIPNDFEVEELRKKIQSLRISQKEE